MRRQKKCAQKVWSQDLVHEKPFGYRVVQHTLINFLSLLPIILLSSKYLNNNY